MHRRKVLVTGATGFLGGAVCAHLRAAGGWEVTATGRDPDKGALVAADRFVPADLADKGAATALTRGQEAVIHCAALASPWGRKEDFERANIAATAALLEASISARTRRFVHVSTPSIYGEHVHREGLTEASPLRVWRARRSTSPTASRCPYGMPWDNFSPLRDCRHHADTCHSRWSGRVPRWRRHGRATFPGKNLF